MSDDTIQPAMERGHEEPGVVSVTDVIDSVVAEADETKSPTTDTIPASSLVILPKAVSCFVEYTTVSLNHFSSYGARASCRFLGRECPAETVAATLVQSVALAMARANSNSESTALLRLFNGESNTCIETQLELAWCSVAPTRSMIPSSTVRIMLDALLTKLPKALTAHDMTTARAVLDNELASTEMNAYIHRLMHQRNTRETLAQCITRHASVDIVSSSITLQCESELDEVCVTRPWSHQLTQGDAGPFAPAAEIAHFGLEHLCFLFLVVEVTRTSLEPNTLKLLLDLWHASYAMFFAKSRRTVLYDGDEVFRDVYARFKQSDTKCPLACDIPLASSYLVFSALTRKRPELRLPLLRALVHQSIAIVTATLVQGNVTPTFTSDVYCMVRRDAKTHYALDMPWENMPSEQLTFMKLARCTPGTVTLDEYSGGTALPLQCEDDVTCLRKTMLHWLMKSFIPVVEGRCRTDRVLLMLWQALCASASMTVERAVYLFTASKVDVLLSTGSSEFHRSMHHMPADSCGPLFPFDDVRASYVEWHARTGIPEAFLSDYVELGSLASECMYSVAPPSNTHKSASRLIPEWWRLVEHVCATFADTCVYTKRQFRQLARAIELSADGAPTAPILMNRWKYRLLTAFDALSKEHATFSDDHDPDSVWALLVDDMRTQSWNTDQSTLLRLHYSDATDHPFSEYVVLIVYASDFHDLFDVCMHAQRWWPCSETEDKEDSDDDGMPQETIASRRTHVLSDVGVRLGSKYAVAIPHAMFDEESDFRNASTESSQGDTIRALFESCHAPFAQCSLVRLSQKKNGVSSPIPTLYVPDLRKCDHIPLTGTWHVPVACRRAHLAPASGWYLTPRDFAVWTHHRQYRHAYFGSSDGDHTQRPWYSLQESPSRCASYHAPCKATSIHEERAWEDHVFAHAQRCHESEPAVIVSDTAHVMCGVYIWQDADGCILPAMVDVLSFPADTRAEHLTPALFCPRDASLLLPMYCIEAHVYFTHAELTAFRHILHPSLYHRTFHVVMCLEPLMERHDWEAWKMSDAGRACASSESKDAAYLTGLCKHLMLCHSFAVADENSTRYRRNSLIWDSVATDTAVDAHVVCELLRTFLCMGAWTSRRFGDTSHEDESGVGTVRLACVAVQCYSA